MAGTEAHIAFAPPSPPDAEVVFLDWCELPEGTRPDFLTYAHRRRAPAIERRDAAPRTPFVTSSREDREDNAAQREDNADWGRGAL